MVAIVEHSAYRPTGFIDPVSPVMRRVTHQTPMIASPAAAMNSSAFTGVPDRGRTWPSLAGSNPVRPASNSMCDWESAPATRVASTDTIPEDEQGGRDRHRDVESPGYGPPWIAGLLGERGAVFPPDEHEQGQGEARGKAGQATGEVGPGERYARQVGTLAHEDQEADRDHDRHLNAHRHAHGRGRPLD